LKTRLPILVEVPQDGRRRGLKFRLSTSRHCSIIAHTSWYIYQLARQRIIWILVPLLPVSFERVLIGFMCRYIYLHIKQYIVSAQATSGTIGKRAEGGRQPTFWSERAEGARSRPAAADRASSPGPCSAPPARCTPKPSAPATKCPSDAGTPPLEARCQIAIKLQG
jgi:hypothetical protein